MLFELTASMICDVGQMFIKQTEASHFIVMPIVYSSAEGLTQTHYIFSSIH